MTARRGRTMFVWATRSDSTIYHRAVDVVLTPRGKRFETACGKQLGQVQVAIGRVAMPPGVARRRRLCRGCDRMTGKGKQ